jgi:hypothetical protein
MTMKWIPYFLLLLIALQSVMAMADTHQDHQSEVGHETLENPRAALETPTSMESNESADCQHCCHCHSPQLNLLSATAFSNSDLSLKNFSEPGPRAHSKHLFSLYRPPRV